MFRLQSARGRRYGPHSGRSYSRERGRRSDQSLRACHPFRNARHRFKAHAVCVPDEWVEYGAHALTMADRGTSELLLRSARCLAIVQLTLNLRISVKGLGTRKEQFPLIGWRLFFDEPIKGDVKNNSSPSSQRGDG